MTLQPFFERFPIRATAMDLLDSLPDHQSQLVRERDALLRRLAGPEYTDEQRAAQARAFQQAQTRANADRNATLNEARETDFSRSVQTNQRMDPHPQRVRYVPAQDPAGGRKKRRRRAAARRSAPSTQNTTTTQRFPNVPAHRTPDQIAEDNMTGVRNWHSENAKDGTFTAYEPKKQEWDEFCAAVYGPTATLNHGVPTLLELPPQVLIQVYTVSPNKCYNFIFYQAHRKRRPRRPANSVQFGDAELQEYN